MSEKLRLASLQLVAALVAEDLEQAGRALEERARAMAAGALPTEETIVLGDRAAALLQDMKRRVGFDATRLQQVQQRLPPEFSQPHIDLRF